MRRTGFAKDVVYRLELTTVFRPADAVLPIPRAHAFAAGHSDVDVVFAPRIDDAHQDHRLLGSMAPTVWRDALVLHYEIPKWDGDLGRSNCYVPISAELGQRKVSLLNKYYPSQQSRDWWDDETFLALMRIRGMECRSRYAEAFQASKAVLSLDN